MGLLFGAAIGDALGVLTEFCETKEHAERLVDSLPGRKLQYRDWPRSERTGPNVPEGLTNFSRVDLHPQRTSI